METYSFQGLLEVGDVSCHGNSVRPRSSSHVSLSISSLIIANSFVAAGVKVI